MFGACTTCSVLVPRLGGVGDPDPHLSYLIPVHARIDFKSKRGSLMRLFHLDGMSDQECLAIWGRTRAGCERYQRRDDLLAVIFYVVCYGWGVFVIGQCEKIVRVFRHFV